MVDVTQYHNQHDPGRIYGEFILAWLMENIHDGREIDDFTMLQGSGLPVTEFQIGIAWLVKNNYIFRREERIH